MNRKKMKVLVLGGSGMLGHKLVQVWRDRFEVWTTFRGKSSDYNKYGLCDQGRALSYVSTENFDSVLNAFATVKPAVVVNCIGVIKQLKSAKDPIPTLTINSIFPHRLAKMCQAANARLISLSTDCVFSGERGNYSESDTPDATDLYGQSKHWGEVGGENCLTVRTSIIGRELETAHSLVEWFLAQRGGRARGFTNAIYSGFPTVVLADVLANLIENHPQLNGVRQISSEPINKFELLCLIRDAYQADVEIEPFDDFRIDRSLNSSLFRAETNFKPLGWREMIELMAADETPYDDWRKK